MMKLKPIIFTMLCAAFSFGQNDSTKNALIEQLKEKIANAKNDSVKVNAYFEWDDLIWLTDPKLDYELNTKAELLCRSKLKKELSQSEKHFYQTKHAKALNNLGSIHFDRGEYHKSIQLNTESLIIRQKLKDQEGIAGSYNNLGNAYLSLGNHTKAIAYYTNSLKTFEKIGNKRSQAIALNNIGTIYKDQNELSKSMEYHLKSLKLRRELGDKNEIAYSLNNIAILFQAEEDHEKAIRYFKESMALHQQEQNQRGISAVLNNMGISYKYLKQYKKAIDHFNQSIRIDKTGENIEGQSISMSNIGAAYFEMGNFNLAIKYSAIGLELAKKTGSKITIRDASGTLYECYKHTKNSKKALEMHELHVKTKDKLNSEENRKEVIRQEYKYAYETQSAKDSIKSANEKEIVDAKLKAELYKNEQQEQQALFLYGILLISFVFAGVVFNRFRITRKQKVLIEEQKQKVDDAFEILEEKNTEILDSIVYAKRIQSAILPSLSAVNALLPDNFIIYKPKDIVAGDFYWIEKKDDCILFAAADCTGHGVPGAMVSVVCNNALNRAVREYHLTDPGLILNKTREIVVAEFGKNDQDVKDGMDIALCVLEGNRLSYAGAHNPLWIMRDGELIEIRANKQPIGKFEQNVSFETHSMELFKDDTIYIFSDGFVDQFGGEFGKKFMKQRFKELLGTIQHNTMEEQQEFINSAFEDWKGEYEQLDDVCVIGVRI